MMTDILRLFREFDHAVDDARLNRDYDSPSGWANFFSRAFSCQAFISIETYCGEPVQALAAAESTQAFLEALDRETDSSLIYRPSLVLGERKVGDLVLYRPDGPCFSSQERENLDHLMMRLDSEMDILAGILGRHAIAEKIDEHLDTFSLMRGIVGAVELFLSFCSSNAGAFVVFRDNASDEAGVISLCFRDGRYKSTGESRFYRYERGEWIPEGDTLAHFDIRPLIKRNFDGDTVTIGILGIKKRCVPLWIEPVLDSLAWQIDSRIAGYQLMRDSLLRFMDSSLVDMVISSKGALDQVLAPKMLEIAMLYADLVGFSALCSSTLKDPEQVLEVINEWSTRMQELVFKKRRGVRGIWDKMIGDCVVALIGPQSEATPEIVVSNTVDLGADMVRETSRMHESLDILRGKKLELRVGIHFGKVIVGELGPRVSRDFTALGHDMNLAARIQSAAKPGEVLASRRLVELAGNNLKFAAPRTIVAKNIGEVQVYPVILQM